MPEDKRIIDFKKTTEELLSKIDSYQKQPDVIIISEKDILNGSANVLIAASTVLTGFWAKAFLLIGNIIIKSLPKKGDPSG